MKIEISYPGQEVKVIDAPPHLIAHYEKFGGMPPFNKIVEDLPSNGDAVVKVR